jgi:phage/plasmid-like protein (TIGR03299 family)
VFSYPSKGYTIHPFLDTLSGLVQAIQYDQAVQCGSVGLLKKGGQAFLQAVLPENLEVEGYGYQTYLLAVTSVDLSRSTSWSTGMKGAICDNTVAGAIGAAATIVRKRHTGAPLTVQFAREKLGIRLQAAGEEIGKAITELCAVDVTERDFALWLDEIQPKVTPDPRSSTGGAKFTNAEAKRSELTRLWTSDPKVKPWAGTAFGILQAGNTYRNWAGKVTGEGGRVEQNYSRLADGRTASADVEELAILGRILEARKVHAAA